MYALALRTSSRVVSRTTVSLIYAQRLGWVDELELDVDEELGMEVVSGVGVVDGCGRDGGRAV
jgi:hypothetical protein